MKTCLQEKNRATVRWMGRDAGRKHGYGGASDRKTANMDRCAGERIHRVSLLLWKNLHKMTPENPVVGRETPAVEVQNGNMRLGEGAAAC